MNGERTKKGQEIWRLCSHFFSHQTDVPPWIIRFRVWDSSITATSGRNLPSGPTASTSTIPPNMRPFHPTMNSSVTGSYYYYPADQQPSPNDRRVNVDNAWNPVDNYIYGPTRSSVFNHNNPYGGGSVVPSPAPPAPNRFDKLNNGLSNIKETFNYIANTKYTHNQYSGAQLNNILQRQPETNTVISLDGFVGHPSSGGYKKPPSNRFLQQEKNAGGGRKLLLEIFDNETPKLCDHTALKEASGTTSKTRPCTPLESYVSAGNDLVSLTVNRWGNWEHVKLLFKSAISLPQTIDLITREVHGNFEIYVTCRHSIQLSRLMAPKLGGECGILSLLKW